jgi:ParB-like chromosome segregation protein Spo0J
MDAVTPPDFAALRREVDEARDAMRLAIEVRDVPAIERVFVRAMHVLADAQGLAARYRQEKNVESRYASNEIVLGIEHLRGQWLITTERVGLRFLQPKNTKFGAPTGGVMLDAAGQPPRIFINRKKSAQLQAFAKLTEQQVKAALADKTRMLTMTGILRLYAKPKRMDYPFHPICDDYAPFTSEEMQDLRKSLRERGLVVPIVTWRKQTVDGKHRTRGCKEEGIPLRYRDITKQCPTEDEMRAYVAALNEHRRANTKPLTSKQKRERIEAALKADPERSDVVIAMEVGATHPTVGHIRQELEAEGVVNFTAPSERKSQTGKKGEGQRRTPRKPKRTPPAVNDATDDVARPDKPVKRDVAPPTATPAPTPEEAAAERKALYAFNEQTSPDDDADLPVNFERKRQKLSLDVRLGNLIFLVEHQINALVPEVRAAGRLPELYRRVRNLVDRLEAQAVVDANLDESENGAEPAAVDRATPAQEECLHRPELPPAA